MKNTYNPFLYKPHIQDNQVPSNRYVTLTMTLQRLLKWVDPGPFVNYFLYNKGYNNLSEYLESKLHCKIIYELDHWLIVETLEGEEETISTAFVKKIEEMNQGIKMLWRLKEEDHEECRTNL